MKPVYFTGCGAVFNRGIYSLSSAKTWDATQDSVETIRRDQVLDTPLPTFGKLNLPDKLAFCAASLALESNKGCGSDRSGICIAIPYGSLTTDMFFMESVIGSLPSPAYFSATLPSSAISDIAIYYKFKGPDRVFCGGNSPVFETLCAAHALLQLDKADTVIFLATWAVDSTNRTRLKEYAFQPNAAFAVLLTTVKPDNKPCCCRIVSENRHAQYDPPTEFDFCTRLTDALRCGQKQFIPFSQSSSENYFEIV